MNWIALPLKLVVACALLVFVAHYVDVPDAFRRIAKVDIGSFLVATGLILGQHVFAAGRWCAVSEATSFRLPYRIALTSYLKANFFNLALPSTIGGDAFRVWRCVCHGVTLKDATLGVLIDRAFGLLVLALLAVIGARAIYPMPGGAPIGLALGIMSAMVVACAAIGAALSSVLPGMRRWSIGRPLCWLSDGVLQILRQPKLTARVLGHSLAGHLVTVVAFERLAAGLDISLGLGLAICALPAILLFSALPISISGWGIREGTGVLVLSSLGVSPELALALSLLLGLALLLVGLTGGAIWLMHNDRAAFETVQHDRQCVDFASSTSSDLKQFGWTEGAIHAFSDRKLDILVHAERSAETRDEWISANPAYFGDDRRYMRFLVPEGASVLDLGCATGDLLARLKPSRGVGIDLSPRMIRRASAKYPELEFLVGDAEDPKTLDSIKGPFDYILLSDTIGLFDDMVSALRLLHRVCNPETRIIIGYYSHFWEPVIYLGERLGFRQRQPRPNFLSTIDFENVIYLADFEIIRREWRQIVPMRLLGIGPFLNRYVGTLPLIRRLCLRRYVIARSLRVTETAPLPVSVIVPCRNERGNIESAVRRMPRFGSHQEIVFVEGNSTDDTYDECVRVKRLYADQWDIKVVKQQGIGKCDAMSEGYATARGDVLMILDADLAVPPEALPGFYEAIMSGKGEFINGSRLIYPMQAGAMRSLNLIANRIFAWLFTYLLNQRFTDTLCGTKVFRRRAYDKIAGGRSYFGDFDPFGDFDLIFGASKQSLKIVEVPVHYKACTYGDTQISRFRDGLLLLRMVLFAWRKLKAI